MSFLLFPVPLLFVLDYLVGWLVGSSVPILFANSVHISGLHKGSIILASPERFGVRIGFGGSLGITSKKSSMIFAKSGSITFEGRGSFARGVTLRVNEGGCLVFGGGFNSNKNCQFFCNHGIRFGKDCLLGWDVSIRDEDGHSIFRSRNIEDDRSPEINVGDHVWITANVDVLKGSYIPNGSIVATRALVTKAFSEPNVLIGGLPAKILRHEVSWKL